MRFALLLPKQITDDHASRQQKLKGQESLGFEDAHKDPGLGGSCSPAGCPSVQEARDLYFPGPEATEQSETGKSKMCSRSAADLNLMAGDGQTALHAADPKRHLEMVNILLEGGANVNKQDASGWTPKALGEQQENKNVYDLSLSYENRRKPDEHRIDLIEPESADTSTYSQSIHRRKGPQSVTSHLKKEPTNSYPSRFSCPTEAGVIKMIKKRVTIHMKLQHNSTSQRQLGRLIILPDSIEELLKIAGKLCLET